jgi:hypothetical protein
LEERLVSRLAAVRSEKQVRIEDPRVAVPVAKGSGKIPSALAAEPQHRKEPPPDLAAPVLEPDARTVGVPLADDSSGDDPTRVWPSEEEEAAFLAGDRYPLPNASLGAISGGAAPAVSLPTGPVLSQAKATGPLDRAPVASLAESGDPVDRGPLPPLDELVARIPAEVRATLDELFRARFTRATRIKEKKTDIPSPVMNSGQS